MGVADSTVVITGGSRGLGFECARAIAAGGAPWRIVLACRDAAAGARAAGEIARATGHREVEAMEVELASLASVRTFARKLLARADLPPLRALVCNAGLQTVSSPRRTVDGYEITFAVNHLAHFLLANLLVGSMREPARVVFVASGTHDPKRKAGLPVPRYNGALVHADPQSTGGLGESERTAGLRRYTTSKLCNVFCTYEMDRRLRERTPDTAVTVNAFDPGAVPRTGLAREHGAFGRAAWDGFAGALVPVLRRAGLPFSTPRDSGGAMARTITDPALDGVSGRYIELGREAPSSETSYDGDAAAELWATSADLVGLRPDQTPLRLTR